MEASKNIFFTYTIVGAGASGLWLAYELLEQGLLVNNTLCMVEGDLNKGNDRTWCFWDTKSTIPKEIISKQWPEILKKNVDTESESLYPFKYFHIRSNDFYQFVKNRLQTNKNVFWENDFVTETNNYHNKVKIQTKNETWYSSFAFLSVLPTAKNNWIESELLFNKNYLQNIGKQKQKVFLWQSFIGWRVKTNSNVFNESKMSMMQFTNIHQGGNTQFMYELPFDKNYALVELTRFGIEKLTKLEAENELKNYMNNKGCSYTIIEEEIGAIPMTNHSDIFRKNLNENERIVYIGAVAGAIKPTTGYGFKRMKAYAENIAKALKNNTQLPTMYRLSRFRFYDTLLLNILYHEPEKGKQIFETLFKTQSIQRILLFLDEKTSLWDEVRIFIRLPIILFLKYLIKNISFK